jgi:lysozyme
MKLSDKGISLIKSFEGCVLKAYLCPASVWTIGYGHTGPEVKKGLVWTQSQADEALQKDASRFESAVNTALKYPVSQNQFDAMVSLAFNIGTAAFSASTLVKKFNSGDIAGAAQQFVVWNKAAGKFNSGLLMRRASEMYHFCKG